MNWPVIDIWRMSASRPWQLEKTHGNLLKYLKYSGELRYHLIESVIEPGYSAKCIHWAKYNGYKIHRIDPAQGQGFAVDYALKNVINCPYSLKIEDDFMPVRDIPLDDCIMVMQQHENVNQICFNKRETMGHKEVDSGGGRMVRWEKEQREYLVIGEAAERIVPLVIKEKWWFGSSLWRTDFIKPIFKYWPRNTHNFFNDLVILPMFGARQGDAQGNGKRILTPKEIEFTVGCFIYGKTGDPQMFEHTGTDDSIWSGQYQERMKKEGRELQGVI